MIRRFKGRYKWLSNFYPCEILFQDKVFPSVEHAYMSAKNPDPEWQAFCTDFSVPARKIKEMSRSLELVENWYDIRISVMRECLREKFSQEPFRSLLLETGEEFIQEGTYWGDTFWGVDIPTNVGENHLGRLIMEIREALRESGQPPV